MSKSLVMRDRRIQLSEAEKETAWRVLTNGLRGIDDKHHKSWVGFLRRMLGMEDGEIAEVATKIARSGPFHRFHMLVEQNVFNSQDRFEHFEQFRNWLKIGAGHVTWVPGAKGGVVPLPKSISYAELPEDEMREFHQAVMAFLRGPHAAPYLWRHLPAGQAAEMMESALEGFER